MSPIQAAILAGDASTGCTTMHIDEGVDTGDMLLQEAIRSDDTDTAGSLSARLAEIGAKLLVRTLDGLIDGSCAAQAAGPRRSRRITKKIKKEHGAIDWSRDAAFLARHVRAMTPWPTAYTFHGGRRLQIDAAATAVAARQRGRSRYDRLARPAFGRVRDGALEMREAQAGRESAP